MVSRRRDLKRWRRPLKGSTYIIDRFKMMPQAEHDTRKFVARTFEAFAFGASIDKVEALAAKLR